MCLQGNLIPSDSSDVNEEKTKVGQVSGADTHFNEITTLQVPWPDEYSSPAITFKISRTRGVLKALVMRLFRYH